MNDGGARDYRRAGEGLGDFRVEIIHGRETDFKGAFGSIYIHTHVSEKSNQTRILYNEV